MLSPQHLISYAEVRLKALQPRMQTTPGSFAYSLRCSLAVCIDAGSGPATPCNIGGLSQLSYKICMNQIFNISINTKLILYRNIVLYLGLQNQEAKLDLKLLGSRDPQNLQSLPSIYLLKLNERWSFTVVMRQSLGYLQAIYIFNGLFMKYIMALVCTQMVANVTCKTVIFTMGSSCFVKNKVLLCGFSLLYFLLQKVNRRDRISKFFLSPLLSQ